MRSLLVLVVLLFPTMALCAEDQITLRSGEVVHGKLLEKGLMSVVIETSKGKRSFPRGSVLKFGEKKDKETPTPKPTATPTATPKPVPKHPMVGTRRPVNPERGPEYAKALRGCAGKTFAPGIEHDRFMTLSSCAAKSGSPAVRAVLREYIGGSLKSPTSKKYFENIYEGCLAHSTDTAVASKEYIAMFGERDKKAIEANKLRKERMDALRKLQKKETDDWIKGLSNDG